MFDRVRIVLHAPSGPANVGAVCRAMANMGLSQLIVTSPRCDIHADPAVGFATHGRHVLDGAREVGSLAEALTGCILTFGTTAREGLYRRQSMLVVEQAARRAVERAAEGDVAFVFGPENHGLTNADLLELDHVVYIPADPAYPVMNLAAAVTIVCYELRKAAGVTSQTPSQLRRSAAPGRRPAPDERKAAMHRLLFGALDRVGFFRREQDPDKLRFALRQILGRVDLTVNECDILTGVARQIDWYVAHHPRRVDPPQEDSP